MHITRILALVVAVAFSASCSPHHPEPGNPGHEQVITGNKVLRCAAGQIPMAVINVIDKVSRALATGDWWANLEELAREVGEDVLACAVRLRGDEAREAYRASQKTAVIQGTIADRAQQFLAAKNYVFLE